MNDWMNRLRNNHYLPYLLAVVFTSFIFWNLWSLTDSPLEDAERPIVEQKMNSSKAQHTNVKKSLQYPLFGVYLPEGDREIKLSSLNIKVVGVVFSNNPENSHVLVELADNEHKIYKVGDVLPGDAQIKKITNNGLVIWYNNRLERINLPLDELEYNPQESPLQQESL